MTKGPEKSDYDELNKYLENYLSQRSDTEADRNIIVWCLYKYHMKLLRMAILFFFKFEPKKFSQHFPGITERWGLIKNAIEESNLQDDQLKKFNSQMEILARFATMSRHSDVAPPLDKMNEIYEDSKNFHDWLLAKGEIFAENQYAKKRESDHYFSRYVDVLAGNFEAVKAELGETPHFTSLIKEYYQEIPTILARLQK